MAHSRAPHETHSAKSDRLLEATRLGRSEGRILLAGRQIHATLPKSYPIEAMEAAGKRFWSSMGYLYPHAHIVAIAESGVPLATGIVSRAPRNAIRSLVAISQLHDFEALDLEVNQGESLVIIDNAIHTGATARAAMRSVGKHGQIAAFIKMFDYGDELESTVRFELFSEFGADIRSLYEISELGADAHRI